MNMRKITSMTMMISFVMLIVNSVVLYIVPQGRVAYWADWHLLGLTKTQWSDQHLTVGVLFLLAGALHIYFNWAAIKAYMKNKARELKIFTPSFNIGLIATAAVIMGTYFQIPPMSTIINISEAIKDMGAEKYGEPPYGHAELSSLKTFAKKEGLDAEKSIKLLKQAGLEVEGASQTLISISTSNRMTPQQVYEVIEKARITGKSDKTTAVMFPDSPRPGFGKQILKDVCIEHNLKTDAVVAGLESMGIDAEPSMTIKEVASNNAKQPMQIFEAIHTIVTGK